jgi:hypothetical protein
MRLTIRFLALLLLLAIATFPSVRPTSTMADDGILIEEGGNPCFEGCVRGYEGCTGKCGLNMSCRQKCEEERMKCEAGCKPLAD